MPHTHTNGHTKSKHPPQKIKAKKSAKKGKVMGKFKVSDVYEIPSGKPKEWSEPEPKADALAILTGCHAEVRGGGLADPFEGCLTAKGAQAIVDLLKANKLLAQ